MTSPSQGPFKFLDAYGVEDSKTFFGREAEIEALYTLVVKSRLVLVYGPSGSGKTSLIQCGLANRFKPTDWFPVFVRRGDDLNTSLDQKIRAEAVTEIEPEADIVAAARSLYLDYYRPLYFIFDQFEELFILGKPEEEAKFFASVQALLASDLNCKIIISMREEYIALLQEFERAVPTLFDSRLRVEQMTLGTVEEVIVGMTAAAGITLEHGAETARRIIAQIGDRRAGVQLAYLQVYLDKLYREAEKAGAHGVFTDALVDKTGALGDVMADFLEEQTQAIADAVRGRHPSLPKGSVHRVLEALTTVEGTKLPMARSDLAERLPGLQPMLDDLLAGLERSRIIRRADDVIEVSHDQLAKRIAERRSADSKALLRVEKLVRDRMAAYDQTRTYLAAEELAVVQPVLPQLALAPVETAFVETSRKKLRWRRLRLIGSTIALVAVLAGFGLYASFQSGQARQAITAASDTTGTITARIANELAVIEKTEAVRQSLLDDLTALNAQLEAIDPTATLDTGFWLDILAGDLLMANEDFEGALKKYDAGLAMARARRAALVDDPTLQDEADWPRNVSIALSRLADLADKMGNPKAAFEFYRKSLAIDEASARANGGVEARHDLVLSYGNFGDFARRRGRLDLARENLSKAVTIAGETGKAAPENGDWQRDYSFYQQMLGKVDRDLGDLASARAAVTDAAARYDAIANTDPARLDWRQDAMWAYRDLAEIERRAGRWAEAGEAVARAEAARSMLSEEIRADYADMLALQRDAIARRDRTPMAE
jgi:tetratricopeptide (TPR) repeat protein